MRKLLFLMAAGALLGFGIVAAGSVTGPGDGGGMWGHGGLRGMREWFKRRPPSADEFDARTRERFARLDRNSDGVIDATEIEAAIVSGRGRGRDGQIGSMRQDMAARFLKRFADKDGKVTRQSFLDEAKRQFQQLDLNNDGKITDDDLPPMMRGRGLLKADGPAINGRWGRVLQQLRAADVNHDGTITLEAFMNLRAKRFDSLDRNKDGVIDAADFELIRKEMVDYQVKRFLHMYGADGDGKITREQFFKIAKERFARGEAIDDGAGRGDRPGRRPWTRWGGGGSQPPPDGPGRPPAPPPGPPPRN